MVGRAITARPWIFWQVADQLGIPWEAPPFAADWNHAPQSPEEEGQLYLLGVSHFAKLLDQYFKDPGKKLRKFRFITQGHKWYVFGHSFYSHCMKMRQWDQVIPQVESYRQRAVSQAGRE